MASNPNAVLRAAAAKISPIVDQIATWWQGDANTSIQIGTVSLPSPAAFYATISAQVSGISAFVTARAAAADADATQTASDRQQCDADRVQTGLDRAQTGADRTQTGLDRASTSTNASNAQTGVPNRGMVRWVNTAALPAYTYANGSNGVGATMTANANGVFPAATADGQTVALGDRFWHRDASGGGGSNIAYGLWSITQLGTASVPWIATRVTDADAGNVLGFACALTQTGTAFAGYAFRVVNDPAATTTGTTAITVVASSSTAGVAGEAAARAAADTTVAANAASALAGFIQTAPGSPALFEVSDPDGFIGFDVSLADGTITSGTNVMGPGNLSLGALQIQSSASPPAALTLQDADGFCVDVIGATGALAGAASSSSQAVSDLAAYAFSDAANVAAALQPNYTVLTGFPGLIYTLNVFSMYGQSFTSGATPILSPNTYASNLMVGGSVHAAINDTTTFSPQGGTANLQPMVANALDQNGNILTNAQIAAGSPTAYVAESPAVAASNAFKLLFNLRSQTVDDVSRKIVTTVSGVNGKPIDQLMKGSPSNYWNKLLGHAQATKTAATNAGISNIGLASMDFLQGQQDYSLNTGYSAYLSRIAQLRTDWINDIHVGVYGGSASNPPAMFMDQAGGEFTTDGNGTSDLCAIGQAQLDFALATPGVFLVGPTYAYTNGTNSAGHLDVNGYRQLGWQIAKVKYRVLVQRQNWRPLYPKSFVLTGNVAVVDFNVPSGQLVFDAPYVQYAKQDFSGKGFYVIDSTSAIAITGIRIVGLTKVEITLARTPVGATYLAYAPKVTYSGNGCLRDTDPTTSADLYIYTANSGADAAANVPALVGKPYALYNWCVAFNLKIQ